MSHLTPDQVLATPAGELAERSSDSLFQLKNDAADLLAAAKAIVESRHAGEFISINDLRTRSKANRSVVDALVVHGCMRGLPEDNQLSFDMFFN